MTNKKPESFKERISSFLNSRYVVMVSSTLFFIIIGIAFYLVYQDAGQMRDLIRHEFNQQQLILARQASNQIEASLRDIQTEVELLTERLEAAYSETECVLALKAVYERTRSKGVIEVGLMTAEGELLHTLHDPNMPPVQPQKVMEEFRQNRDNGFYFGPVEAEILADSTVKVTSLFVKPLALTRDKEGLIFIKLDASYLVEINTFRIQSGKTGYAWTIDENGMTLYHPLRDFIGRNAFTARQELKPFVSFEKINRIMEDRMMQGEEGTSYYVSWWHRGIKGKMTKLIAFSPVKSSMLAPGRVWSVAVAAPISEVAEEVETVYKRHMGAEVAIIAGLIQFALVVVLYQRRTSAALKERVSEQQEFISSILQNSVDAIIFIDNDNEVQVWNKGAEMIFGYSAEEMIGQSFHKLIPPEKDAEKELNRIVEEVKRKGYIKNHVSTRMTKDGRRITVDISRTLIQSKDGKTIGSTAIIKDITEKTEIDQRIYNTEKLASIGILAAGVAHEINNPLAIILGFTDLLMERFEPGSSEYEDLKVIEENGYHAKMIVENLLGFARITEGLEDIVDINQSLETVLNIVKNTLMTRKIEVEIEVPIELSRVKGDTREFQQVIFNLINNSVAAMTPKGGRLKIAAWQENNWVNVSVSDTGEGIPEINKPHIFDPFFTTKKVGEGTGLGLSLCYGIVKKYGGRISFTSVSAEDHPEEKSGTTFTVAMPVPAGEKS